VCSKWLVRYPVYKARLTSGRPQAPPYEEIQKVARDAYESNLNLLKAVRLPESLVGLQAVPLYRFLIDFSDSAFLL
jgi:hypothetical protein